MKTSLVVSVLALAFTLSCTRDALSPAEVSAADRARAIEQLDGATAVLADAVHGGRIPLGPREDRPKERALYGAAPDVQAILRGGVPAPREATAFLDEVTQAFPRR